MTQSKAIVVVGSLLAITLSAFPVSAQEIAATPPKNLLIGGLNLDEVFVDEAAMAVVPEWTRSGTYGRLGLGHSPFFPEGPGNVSD